MLETDIVFSWDCWLKIRADRAINLESRCYIQLNAPELSVNRAGASHRAGSSNQPVTDIHHRFDLKTKRRVLSAAGRCKREGFRSSAAYPSPKPKSIDRLPERFGWGSARVAKKLEILCAAASGNPATRDVVIPVLDPQISHRHRLSSGRFAESGSVSDIDDVDIVLIDSSFDSH